MSISDVTKFGKKVKCVVPISGGKDSQACLALAIEEFGKEWVIGLFCDTGYEHDLTYSHIEYMKDMYDVEIITRCEGDVLSHARKQGYFPHGLARFCTNALKIIPAKKFYKALAEEQGGFEVWMGMRSGESHGRAKRYANINDGESYPPHEVMGSKFPKYLHKLGVSMRLPIVDWTADEVLEFLDGNENPLYKAGFNRVGCFPCLAGSDRQMEKSFQFDDLGRQRWKEVQEMEKELGVKVFRSKGGLARNYDNDSDDDVCSICQI